MKIDFKKLNTNLPSLTHQILDANGLTMDWLTAGRESFHDGHLLHNFTKGRDLLSRHLEGKIGILVDTDCDGYSSSSIIYQWIFDKNPNANVRVFIQEGKVHGIIMSTFEDADLDLLIVPDAGSGQIADHKKLKERCIDILVLDHHEMGEESEYATIINPHNSACKYPNKALSGGAVVYKFIEAIDQERGSLDYLKYIDLAGVSIISDMMSIKSMENKALVNIGLKNLSNPYFTAAYKADQRLVGKKVGPMTIAFYVVPVINATIRMGSQEDKMNLFLAMAGVERAEPIIASLLKVKGKQDRSKEPLITRICYDLQTSGRDQGKIIFAIPPKNTPKSLTGLIAGQMTGLYNRPVLLGRLDDKGNYTGSLRSINDSTVEDLKGFCNDSGLFNWVEGHPGAAGWSLPEENLQKFLDYVDEKLPPVEKVYKPIVDLNLVDDESDTIFELAKLEEHLATDFKEVLVYKELKITAANLRIMGAKANVLSVEDFSTGIKYIKFNHKNGIKITGFGKFSFENEEYESGIIRLVGKANVNEWNGKLEAQVFIENLEFIPQVEEATKPDYRNIL